MYFLVYKTTCLKNNKIYIGVHRTTNLNDGYIGSGTMLQRAIKKYGKSAFRIEILFNFDSAKDMLDKERELVSEEFILRQDTYNQTIGGDEKLEFVNKTGKNLYGRNRENFISQQPLARAALAKLRLDPEWREKNSKNIIAALKKSYTNRHGTFLGKTHNAQTKAKIGANSKIHQSGKGNSQYGKPRPESVKLRIAESVKKTLAAKKVCNFGAIV